MAGSTTGRKRGPYKQREREPVKPNKLLDAIQNRDSSVVPQLNIRRNLEDSHQATAIVRVGNKQSDNGDKGDPVFMMPIKVGKGKSEHQIKFFGISVSGKMSETERTAIVWEEDNISFHRFSTESAKLRWPIDSTRKSEHTKWLLFVWEHLTGDSLPTGKTTSKQTSKKRKRADVSLELEDCDDEELGVLDAGEDPDLKVDVKAAAVVGTGKETGKEKQLEAEIRQPTATVAKSYKKAKGRKSPAKHALGGDDDKVQAYKKATTENIHELFPRIERLRRDKEIVETAEEDLKNCYVAVLATLQEILDRLNRDNSFPITGIDEFAIPKWDALVVRLSPTTSRPQAEHDFYSLRDAIDLEIGKLVSGVKRNYGKLRAKVEKQYKEIRDPVWLLSDVVVCTNIMNEECTKEKVDHQTEAVRTWICETADEWAEIRSHTAARLQKLQEENDVNTLSAVQIEEWRQRTPENRHEALLTMVSDRLVTLPQETMEVGACVAEWCDVRRWMAAWLIDRVRTELNTLAEGYERMVKRAVERFPDLNWEPLEE